MKEPITVRLFLCSGDVRSCWSSGVVVDMNGIASWLTIFSCYFVSLFSTGIRWLGLHKACVYVLVCLPDVCYIHRWYHWKIFATESVQIDLFGSFDVRDMCHQNIFSDAKVSAFIVFSCEAEYDCHQNISSVAVVSVPHGPQLWRVICVIRAFSYFLLSVFFMVLSCKAEYGFYMNHLDFFLS